MWFLLCKYWWLKCSSTVFTAGSKSQSQNTYSLHLFQMSHNVSFYCMWLCSRIMSLRHLEASQPYLRMREGRWLRPVMDFPPQSPDLDPIQHLWWRLKTEKAKHPVTSKKTLCGTLSGRPEITADKIRFSTNLWSPCQRECTLSLQQKGDDSIWWWDILKFMDIFQRFSC